MLTPLDLSLHLGAVRGQLDPDLAAALLVAGAPAWRVAGDLLGGRRYRAELTYDDAPYGVGYFAGAWQP